MSQDFLDAESTPSVEEDRVPAPNWHFVSYIGVFLSIACLGFARNHSHSLANFHLHAAGVFGTVIVLDVLLALYAYWGFSLTGSEGRLIASAPRSGRSWAADILIGAGLGVGLIVASVAIGATFPGAPGNLAPRLAKTGFEHFLEFVAYCVAAVCEEIQFRGYLLQQLLALTRNPGWAVVLQAGFFVFTHGFGQGMSGYLSRFLFGVAFGLIALWRRNLWPSITAHALVDLTVFVVGLS